MQIEYVHSKGIYGSGEYGHYSVGSDVSGPCKECAEPFMCYYFELVLIGQGIRAIC